MTEQLHQLSSPSQLRVADAMVNWATSPSPFGYEGLLSMEMGSPFQQFSPITFGACDSEYTDAVTVFSPSMFSPSKSKVNVTSRLLKKREVRISNQFESTENNEIDLSRIPTLKFIDSVSTSQILKEDVLPKFPESGTSFIRSNYMAGRSLLRDVAIVGGYEMVPKPSGTEKQSCESTEISKRAVFFSPESSMKSNDRFSSNQEHGLGIADISKHRTITTVTEVKVFPTKNNDSDDYVPPLKRKLSRSGSIDHSQSVSNRFVEEGESKISISGSDTKSKGGSTKSVLSSTGNIPVNRCTYTSPSVPNMRDERERGYTETMLVTPSQCKCKKTKCLKL